MLVSNFVVVSSSDDFQSCIDDFNSALEGLAKVVLAANVETIRLVPRQMSELLDNLSFEFYNFSAELREIQSLSSLYYLSNILGKDFVRKGQKTNIVKGFGQAILYQQVVMQLLDIKEELVVVNVQHMNPIYQKHAAILIPNLLKSLRPEDEIELQLMTDFRKAMDRIIVYMKKRGKAKI